MTINEYPEILTPSLIAIGEEIVQRTKDGYAIKRGPEQLGWQFYVQFVKESEAEVAIAAPEAPKRGPKPKAKAAEKEPVEA